MKKASKAKPPNAEDLLAIHLKELRLEFVRQYPFCEGRKWAADFAIAGFTLHGCAVLLEVDGFHKGRHGSGWGADYERDRMAAIKGFFTMRFPSIEVTNGSAKAWILKHLLGGGK